ncbi:MAG: hypothetical protein AAF293_09490, partial [Pseudomonadota bacterium]
GVGIKGIPLHDQCHTVAGRFRYALGDSSNPVNGRATPARGGLGECFRRNLGAFSAISRRV